MYATFWQVMIVLMGIFEQVVFGLCECAHRTDSACCRTAAGGKLNEAWQQDGHQIMYAISLLKHDVVVPVLSKSEGPQKWLAPSGTDVH
jgi:hypothetical protein